MARLHDFSDDAGAAGPLHRSGTDREDEKQSQRVSALEVGGKNDMADDMEPNDAAMGESEHALPQDTSTADASDYTEPERQDAESTSKWWQLRKGKWCIGSIVVLILVTICAAYFCHKWWTDYRPAAFYDASNKLSSGQVAINLPHFYYLPSPTDPKATKRSNKIVGLSFPNEIPGYTELQTTTKLPVQDFLKMHKIPMVLFEACVDRFAFIEMTNKGLAIYATRSSKILHPLPYDPRTNYRELVDNSWN